MFEGIVTPGIGMMRSAGPDTEGRVNRLNMFSIKLIMTKMVSPMPIAAPMSK